MNSSISCWLFLEIYPIKNLQQRKWAWSGWPASASASAAVHIRSPGGCARCWRPAFGRSDRRPSGGHGCHWWRWSCRRLGDSRCAAPHRRCADPPPATGRPCLRWRTKFICHHQNIEDSLLGKKSLSYSDVHWKKNEKETDKQVNVNEN